MKHIAVVGAGVVGLCAADALLRRGLQVTVIEKDRTPGQGCSYGNGGLVVPSHFEPLAAPGMVATGLRMLRSKESPFGFSGLPGLEMALWMARFAQAATHAHVTRCAPILRDLNLLSRTLFEDRYGDIEADFHRRGELMVCRTQAALDSEARLGSEAQKLGLKTMVLNRRELEAFETGIRLDAAGAVYFEDDAHLTPTRFMPALRRRVISAGATLLEDAEVSGFEIRDGKVTTLRTSVSEVPVDEVILAAGAWTGTLAKNLGLKIPLLAGKGYGFTVTEPPEMPRYPAILVEGRVAVTPMSDGLRFVGTMELGLPTVPKINEARLRGMRQAIAEAYPAFRGYGFESIPVWAGLRPCAPDGMPFLGRTQKLRNVVVATGHGMMGMSLGPVSGELIAQVVTGEPASVSLELLNPDRYA